MEELVACEHHFSTFLSRRLAIRIDSIPYKRKKKEKKTKISPKKRKKNKKNEEE